LPCGGVNLGLGFLLQLQAADIGCDADDFMPDELSAAIPPAEVNAFADGVLAGEVAAALKAEKLIMLTDVEGIQDEQKVLISSLKRADIAKLIEQGVIYEGMLPKVEACLTALDGGVRKAHIIDGRQDHALLLEVFTNRGIGTEIVAY